MNLTELVETFKEAQKSGPQPYDTQATVQYIEGDTAWVEIPGSEDVTPVNMTIAAKEGDTVQVRVSGGTAFLVGNSTAPPTDDTQAYVAQARAEEVQDDLNEQKEYFWHDDDGAHIQGTQSGYRNDLKSDGMHIVETETGTEVATFSTSIIELGKNTVNSVIKMINGLYKIAVTTLAGVSRIGVISMTDTVNPMAGETGLTRLQINATNIGYQNSGTKAAYIELAASYTPNNKSSSIMMSADNIYMNGTLTDFSQNPYTKQTSTTTWTSPTASGASKNAGGYYVEGKHVYVSIQCKLSSAASSGDNVTLFTGLTAPLFMVPLEVMVANQRNGVAWINDSGELHFRPTASVSTSNAVIINGHYTSA